MPRAQQQMPGVTLKRILRGLEKYAIPLLLGVVIAMVLKNTEREWHVTLRTHPLQVYVSSRTLMGCTDLLRRMTGALHQ